MFIHGADVFFFEDYFYADSFEIADSLQSIYRVSGEAADGLGEDEVNLSSFSVGGHRPKAIALFGISAEDAFIGINTSKVPTGMICDELVVVGNLSRD